MSEVIFDHFSSIMERPNPRQRDLKWQALGIEPADLSSLADPFTEEEITKAIHEMPIDKALALMDLQGTSLKACWEIIKHNIVAAFNAVTVLSAVKIGPWLAQPRRKNDFFAYVWLQFSPVTAQSGDSSSVWPTHFSLARLASFMKLRHWFNVVYSLTCNHLNLLNSANKILKKEGAKKNH